MILYWRVWFFAHNLMWGDSTSCYARYTRWILFKVNTRSPKQSMEMSKGQGSMIMWSLLLNALSLYITYLLWEVETQVNEMANFLLKKNSIKYFQNGNFKSVLGILKCNASRHPTHGIQHWILLSHSNTLHINIIPISGLLLWWHKTSFHYDFEFMLHANNYFF